MSSSSVAASVAAVTPVASILTAEMFGYAFVAVIVAILFYGVWWHCTKL